MKRSSSHKYADTRRADEALGRLPGRQDKSVEADSAPSCFDADCSFHQYFAHAEQPTGKNSRLALGWVPDIDESAGRR
eukprot:1043421-Pleurochrysis_carterae.AAC.1